MEPERGYKSVNAQTMGDILEGRRLDEDKSDLFNSIGAKVINKSIDCGNTIGDILNVGDKGQRVINGVFFGLGVVSLSVKFPSLCLASACKNALRSIKEFEKVEPKDQKEELAEAKASLLELKTNDGPLARSNVEKTFNKLRQQEYYKHSGVFFSDGAFYKDKEISDAIKWLNDFKSAYDKDDPKHSIKKYNDSAPSKPDGLTPTRAYSKLKETLFSALPKEDISTVDQTSKLPPKLTENELKNISILTDDYAKLTKEASKQNVNLDEVIKQMTLLPGQVSLDPGQVSLINILKNGGKGSNEFAQETAIRFYDTYEEKIMNQIKEQGKLQNERS